ncbi:hypothetical protein FLGE108171_12320 [Flavobacterium gelidilacus]
MFSQKVIIEEKFEKDNVPLGYNFLSQKNELVIQKGKHIGISTNREIHELVCYDSKGNKKVLLENAEVMNPDFSYSENTFRVIDYAKMSYSGSTYKFIKEGKDSKKYDVKEYYNYFIDDYQFNIENQKGKTFSKINFEKDDLYLNSMNLNTNKVNKFKIEKPDISRLVGGENVKYAKDLTFSVMPKKENFELITKSINSDYKSMVLYRTVYNFEGKKVKDLNYNINIKANYLMYCFNGGGQIGYNSNGFPAFEDDLNINNFIIDELSNEVYVFGLIGKKDRSASYFKNEPLGYYIFKFNEKGDKIWESINMISDKKDFNDDQIISKLNAFLTIQNNQLIFTTGPSLFTGKDIMHYSEIEISSGKLISSSKLNYEQIKRASMMTGTRDFLLSFMELEKMKNKAFDYAALIMYNKDSKFKKYIDSINSKNEVSFNTIINKEGTWLIESDNSTYYKVTYF